MFLDRSDESTVIQSMLRAKGGGFNGNTEGDGTRLGGSLVLGPGNQEFYSNTSQKNLVTTPLFRIYLLPLTRLHHLIQQINSPQHELFLQSLELTYCCSFTYIIAYTMFHYDGMQLKCHFLCCCISHEILDISKFIYTV